MKKISPAAEFGNAQGQRCDLTECQDSRCVPLNSKLQSCDASVPERCPFVAFDVTISCEFLQVSLSGGSCRETVNLCLALQSLLKRSGGRKFLSRLASHFHIRYGSFPILYSCIVFSSCVCDLPND